eukprot:g5007.t1
MATNVIVAVRTRPFNSREKKLGCKECIVMRDGVSTTITGNAGQGGKTTTFTYDKSYWYDTPQEKLFKDLGVEVVNKGVEGYNGTIFAYGQTGSGKTYSMMGVPGDLGLIPRLNNYLFEALEKNKAKNHQYFVTVSYLEIYNEVIKDLLNPSDAHLKIREHPDMGIYVEGIAEIKANAAGDIEKFIEQGNKVRTVAETKMNARSSRSHSCFTIRISQKTVEELDGGVTRESKLDSKLNLVDLAGSERAGKTGAAGDRLKEAGAINMSLSALGNVINALAKGGKSFVPYRDSKLTRLLQESLGGNARTVMIAALSPADDNYDETLGTLQYASRAKKIQNKATKNEDVNEKVIRELKTEIDELKAQLAAIADGKPMPGSMDSSVQQDYLNKIAILERAQKDSWEEKERLSKQFEEERKKILENENHIRDVMQTVKVENIEAMKRVRALQHEKVMLKREFAGKMNEREGLKQSLAKSISQLKHMRGLEAEGKPQDQRVMRNLLVFIDTKRKALEVNKEELEEIQTFIKENEERTTEERAEISAHKMVLSQDHKLRAAIAEEEKQKFLKEKEQYLESILSKERERLKAEAEAEVAKVKAKYRRSGGGDSSKHRELEINAIQSSADNSSLILEIKTLKEKHEHAVEVIENQHKIAWEKRNKETADMVKLIVEGFETEMKMVRKKFHTCSKLLNQAVKDIDYLTKRNAELEEGKK